MFSRKRSFIWTSSSEAGPKEAKCNFCYCIVKFNGGSTSNLYRHMQTKHPLVETSRSIKSLQNNSSSLSPNVLAVEVNSLLSTTTSSEHPNSFTDTDSHESQPQLPGPSTSRATTQSLYLVRLERMEHSLE